MSDQTLILQVTFTYTNYKGITTKRHVLPMENRFGDTEWHLEHQWLLKAYDYDRDEQREFAIKDIKDWETVLKTEI